jgi:L-alanine-DL-glutamate epimerase-like enolase superfamily enzyme
LDAWACAARQPLWESLGWPSPALGGYSTLVTYGGTNPDRICQEIAAEKPAGIKLKLTGADTDLLVVREVWKAFHLPVALDLNGAWEWDQAVQQLRSLEAEDIGLLWVEQPCRAGTLRSKLPTRLPIFADEAAGDPAFEWDTYDGILLKPAALGLLRCARLGRLARDRGKAVTLGCHLQSSLLTSASLSLGGFISEQWVDLDSAILVGDDPFRQLPIDRKTGLIRLAQGPGLATSPVTNLAWST